MRHRSAPRYSFICFRRLRSTAMWVILWFSTSSWFLNVLVRLRFLRPAGASWPAVPSVPSFAAVPGGGVFAPRASVFGVREVQGASKLPCFPPPTSHSDSIPLCSAKARHHAAPPTLYRSFMVQPWRSRENTTASSAICFAVDSGENTNQGTQTERARPFPPCGEGNLKASMKPKETAQHFRMKPKEGKRHK